MVHSGPSLVATVESLDILKTAALFCPDVAFLGLY